MWLQPGEQQYLSSMYRCGWAPTCYFNLIIYYNWPLPTSPLCSLIFFPYSSPCSGNLQVYSQHLKWTLLSLPVLFLEHSSAIPFTSAPFALEKHYNLLNTNFQVHLHPLRHLSSPHAILQRRQEGQSPLSHETRV